MERIFRPKHLTLQELKNMKPGTIFDSGEFIDEFGGCNISDTKNRVPWLAIRGQIHDWAIYFQNPYSETKWSQDMIKKMGDKMRTKTNVKKLVDCTNEAFEMYRL